MKDDFKSKKIDVIIAIISLLTTFIGAALGSSIGITNTLQQETLYANSNNIQNYGAQTNNYFTVDNKKDITGDNIVKIPSQSTENFETVPPVKILKNDTSIILIINKDLFKTYYINYKPQDDSLFRCGIRLYDKNAIRSWGYFIGVTWDIDDELNINNAYAILCQMKEDKNDLLDTGKRLSFQAFVDDNNYILFGEVSNEYIDIENLTITPLDMFFMLDEKMYIIG